MQISRRKVIDMGLALMQAENIFQKPITGKFYYACVKNRDMAKEEYKLYLEANPYPPQWDEYEAKRVAALNEVGETIKEGFGKLPSEARDAILNSDDPNVMPQAKRELLVARVGDLRKEYKEVLDEVDNINRKRDEYLDEEDDYPIKKVKLSELPEIVGGNGYAIIQALDPMIIED
jgi:arginase family enzyme